MRIPLKTALAAAALFSGTALAQTSDFATVMAGAMQRMHQAMAVPSTGDPAGLYASNVQIAELNALNAALAVLAWKRMFGFYATGRDFDHGIFVVETGAMHREGRVDRKEQA